MSYYNGYNDSSSGGGLFLLLIGVVILVIAISGSCTNQAQTRSWGGTMEVELEPNQKLMEITWKDDSLWYLTRDMTEKDVAENYKFQEKDSRGWLEGTVFIKERKMTEEEFKAYQESKTLEEIYYNSGNLIYDSEGKVTENFIHYDVDTDTYSVIKDYVIDESTGELKPIK